MVISDSRTIVDKYDHKQVEIFETNNIDAYIVQINTLYITSQHADIDLTERIHHKIPKIQKHLEQLLIKYPSANRLNTLQYIPPQNEQIIRITPITHATRVKQPQKRKILPMISLEDCTSCP
jgi:hypothetical protein